MHACTKTLFFLFSLIRYFLLLLRLVAAAPLPLLPLPLAFVQEGSPFKHISNLPFPVKSPSFFESLFFIGESKLLFRRFGCCEEGISFSVVTTRRSTREVIFLLPKQSDFSGTFLPSLTFTHLSLFFFPPPQQKIWFRTTTAF